MRQKIPTQVISNLQQISGKHQCSLIRKRNVNKKKKKHFNNRNYCHHKLSFLTNIKTIFHLKRKEIKIIARKYI